MTKRKPNIKRTPERLIRLAYDLEEVAARLREAGYPSHAATVRDISSLAGKVGRSLDEALNRAS